MAGKLKPKYVAEAEGEGSLNAPKNFTTPSGVRDPRNPTHSIYKNKKGA